MVFELVLVALAAICIVIAPVFSGEYQAGTDAVILSAKYGKTKLVTAKIVASLLFGLLAFTLHMVIPFGLPLMAFGVDGWNLPLQSGNTVIPYPFTFMQDQDCRIIYFCLCNSQPLLHAAFESGFRTFFTISTKCANRFVNIVRGYYQYDQNGCEYRPRGFYEAEYPDIPYPEVVDYIVNDADEKNPEGTITLTVNVVYPNSNTSKAYSHRTLKVV